MIVQVFACMNGLSMLRSHQSPTKIRNILCCSGGRNETTLRSIDSTAKSANGGLIGCGESARSYTARSSFSGACNA